MAQVLKASRLDQIVQGAAEVFALYGFKRASMADIAQRSGVALGTLYRYADTKEALFELALRRSLGTPAETLFRSSQGGFEESLLRFCQTQFSGDRFVHLTRALRRPAPGPLPLLGEPAHATEELTLVVGEIFDVVARLRLGIRMLDRSTHEWPELAAVYTESVRGPLLRRLTRYLELRVAVGALRGPPSIPVAARSVVEICAALAMHRYHSPGGNYATDEEARATAIHFVTTVFHPAPVSES